ncbi:hypothetical protein JUN65_02050 [Gluconacetobacter azotocaptans]|uniref:HI1506-related protein n=1 Tax=Gluconacetobacter azotocaptans TaxID=142834 RepID=UPI001957B951|nr:HI1506-related protein [Gluconacetobacter azotocaptans]MBM9400376.1 hypothetical protein [Gluconacetobacter azotocaptans]
MVQKKDGAPSSGAPKEDDAPEDGILGVHVGDGHSVVIDERVGGIRSVLILGAGHRTQVPSGSVVVICTTPGMRRAGVEHKLVTVHDEDRFSEAQITQLRADPAFVVIEVD